MMNNDKSLGQHWLRDRSALSHIANCAELTHDDTVLEIGSGLGTLTSELLRRAGKVVAVEFDSELAQKLPNQFPGKNLEVISGDILKFDLSTLPVNYKVVANIPYYITNKIVQMLMSATNKPQLAVLLVQKEVAQRLAAEPGKMSILSISAQVFAKVTLGDTIPSKLFIPPPKVDSQVVILRMRQIPLFAEAQESDFFRIVKAGFSSKRKKLRSSLAGGSKLSKDEVETILNKANISPAQQNEPLTLEVVSKFFKKFVLYKIDFFIISEQKR